MQQPSDWALRSIRQALAYLSFLVDDANRATHRCFSCHAPLLLHIVTSLLEVGEILAIDRATLSPLLD